jgi:hypothetical protein
MKPGQRRIDPAGFIPDNRAGFNATKAIARQAKRESDKKNRERKARMDRKHAQRAAPAAFQNMTVSLAATTDPAALGLGDSSLRVV